MDEWCRVKNSSIENLRDKKGKFKAESSYQMETQSHLVVILKYDRYSCKL